MKTASGEAVTEFIWLNGQLLAQHQTDGHWIDYIYTGDKRIASVATHVDPVTGNPVADATTYFLTDTVGLTRAAFTSDGTILTEGDFSPFGEELRDRTQHTTHGIGSAASISFSDEVHDDETGLDTYKFRSYNPHLGRWMSPDPSSLRFSSLANPQSFNLYAYVTNDPLKFIDIKGLSEEDSGDYVDVDSTDPGAAPLAGGNSPEDGGGGGSPIVDPNAGGSVDVSGCDADICVTADPDPPLDPTPSDPISSNPYIPDDPSPDPPPVTYVALTPAQLQAIITNAKAKAATCASALASKISGFSLSQFDSQMQNATYNQYPSISNNPLGISSVEANTVNTGPLSGRSTNLFPDFFSDTPDRQASVIVHENIHRYTGWNDAQIVSAFANQGLQPTSYGTDNITQWILNGCH